jgi:hypothetical protein
MAGVSALQRVSLTLATLLLDRMERRTNLVITYGIPRSTTPNNGPRLNLFLYSVRENPAFRNDEDPRRAVSGHYGAPALALELGYLLTTYSAGAAVTISGAPPTLPADSVAELDAQELLADAMRVLHAHPLITRRTQRLHTPFGNLLDAALSFEFESLRVTPRQFTLDEMTKLWTALKEDYQRSVAYEVSIVRVEPQQARPAPAPVLARAIAVQPSVTLGPVLSGLLPDAVVAGERVTLVGQRLDDVTLAVVVSDLAGTEFPAPPVTLNVIRDTAGVHFSVPNDPTRFMPGPKQVVATIAPSPGHLYASEAQALRLLPEITGVTPATGPFDGSVSLTLSGTLLGVAPDPAAPFNPLIPTVLVGGYAIPPADVDYTQLPTQLTAVLRAPADPNDPAAPAPGQVRPIRVRVNGVESRCWRSNPLTQALDIDPAVAFTVT